MGKAQKSTEAAFFTQKYPILSLFVKDEFYQGMNYGLVDGAMELNRIVENFAANHNREALSALKTELIEFLQIERSEKVILKEIWALGAGDFPKGESIIATLQEIATLAGRLHKRWAEWNEKRLREVQELREQEAAWRLSQSAGNKHIYDKSKPKKRKQ
jgi:hypothetical protein